MAKCAQHYRQSWRDKQLAIVIWTDESGDDVTNLEDAIKVCREQKVAVSVVGPSSVLGAVPTFPRSGLFRARAKERIARWRREIGLSA